MDTIKINGVLQLKAYQGDNLIWDHEDNNLIVSSGYLALLSGLSGNSNKNISKVQVGTNSTATNKNDVNISNPLDIDITSFDPTSSKLTIYFTFGEMQGNDQSWSEFGLICADGSLFARKVVPTFTKIQDLTIEGIWTINI